MSFQIVKYKFLQFNQIGTFSGMKFHCLQGGPVSYLVYQLKPVSTFEVSWSFYPDYNNWIAVLKMRFG